MKCQTVMSVGDAGDRCLILGDPGEVTVDVGRASVVGGNRQMGGTEVTPLPGVTLPTLRRTATPLGLGVDREVVPRAARFLTDLSHLGDPGSRLVVRTAKRDPAVAKPLIDVEDVLERPRHRNE